MRDVFPEFYRPTDDEFKTLLERAVIVLDTNVLLSAYKSPKVGREALLSTLEGFKERLWIPHHVALEFQLNRLGVISEQLRAIDNQLSDSSASLAEIQSGVDALELGKRGIDIDPVPITAAIQSADNRIREALERAKSAQIGLGHDDPIRDRLDALFDGRVGAAPTQEGLNAVYKTAQERYELKVPPGFRDANKSRSDGNTYVANALQYNKQYGDYLIWNQTLEHVRTDQITHILFVTSDNKEDWWLQRDGKTIGPLPELIAEMRRTGSVQAFWMYRVHEFLKHASAHLDANVSNQAIEQVQEASASLETEGVIESISEANQSQAEGAVAAWLLTQGEEVSASSAKELDLITTAEDGSRTGYAMVRIKGTLNRSASSTAQPLLSGIARILRAARGHEFARVGLIVVVPEFLTKSAFEAKLNTIKRQYAAMMNINRQIKVVHLGFVSVGEFVPLSSDFN